MELLIAIVLDLKNGARRQDEHVIVEDVNEGTVYLYWHSLYLPKSVCVCPTAKNAALENCDRVLSQLKFYFYARNSQPGD